MGGCRGAGCPTRPEWLFYSLPFYVVNIGIYMFLGEGVCVWVCVRVCARVWGVGACLHVCVRVSNCTHPPTASCGSPAELRECEKSDSTHHPLSLLVPEMFSFHACARAADSFHPTHVQPASQPAVILYVTTCTHHPPPTAKSLTCMRANRLLTKGRSY